MKALVIGNGGREHAIAWRLAQSPRISTVFVAPGNGGTATDPALTSLPISDLQQLAQFAQDEQIALTVVGPEAPLAAGAVDLFRSKGLAVFGPTQAAAQLESSKDFAKAFMLRHHIPTAAYATFTDPQAAHDYVREQGAPIVVKADGLAAGKGVVVALTEDEAHAAIDSMLGDGSLGSAGARVVIEACLEGEEASFIVMCDGKHVLPMASSQDHKRQLDGDKGPNTGGMGAYSPAPIVSEVLHQRIMDEVIWPTIKGMASDGIEYTGFLYAGVMIGDGPDATRPIKVLEFNCRMGDPETQPIMMRIRNDFSEVVEHAIAGTLDQARIDWDPRTALGVVMASHNYPGTPRTGDAITSIPDATDECVTFHAGTRVQEGVLQTSGGRVLCVTALGSTPAAAREIAYAALEKIRFDGSQYRKDIGWRALKPA
ncbi:phosphoribosylamine--glycine ligase [Advenella mimigardefordensis]|uniref:Phosphoribosylamine--glycine ligase n=1 Tax=Advenella mimigardefordensis (strain DSM 17166 / LMG 22922 / DPN7) TaxID=1247726 RepID=W0PCE5_ADVMD|nr:phosphoribosylamine--glycine ligase [Advenella mimigardefordensis]AHG64406.1 phosphoribosylamine--glycine ligase [Advenella mimigardefordensis DPN7]